MGGGCFDFQRYSSPRPPIAINAVLSSSNSPSSSFSTSPYSSFSSIFFVCFFRLFFLLLFSINFFFQLLPFLLLLFLLTVDRCAGNSIDHSELCVRPCIRPCVRPSMRLRVCPSV